MAKGLRSKSKVASRNAKRYDAKTDYAIVQAARLQQTAGRLASKNKSKRTVSDEDAGDVGEDEDEVDKMEADEVSKATTGDDGKTDENGWYHCAKRMDGGDGEAKGEKKGIDRDGLSYILLGLCDPDQMTFAGGDVDDESASPAPSPSSLQLATPHSLSWLMT